jgi:NADH-quinone oxidoreductase subunit L
VLWLVGAAAALLTAFYITRAVTLTFYGQPRDRKIFEGAKESPAVMTVPLVILAVLSTVGGFLGLPLIPGLNAMHNWLGPVLGHATVPGGGEGHGAEAVVGDPTGQAAEGTAAVHAAGHSVGLELGLMAVSVALALAGIAFAWQVYVRQPGRAQALGARMKILNRLLWHKYYVDEIYHAAVVAPFVEFARFLWKGFDVKVVDGLVNGAGRTMRGFADALRPLQSGFAGNYAAAIMVGAVIILGYVLIGGGR